MSSPCRALQPSLRGQSLTPAPGGTFSPGLFLSGRIRSPEVWGDEVTPLLCCSSSHRIGTHLCHGEAFSPWNFCSVFYTGFMIEFQFNPCLGCVVGHPALLARAFCLQREPNCCQQRFGFFRQNLGAFRVE